MVLPVVAVAARGAAAAVGRKTAATSGRRMAASRGGAIDGVRREGIMAKARQVRRVVHSGRMKDIQGRNVHNTRFIGEEPSALLYLGCAMIALLKDLLDLTLVGSLPGIGTVITFCFTFLIWMLLTLFDRSSHLVGVKMRLTRGLVVIFFGLVEAVGFGLNFLPIETTMVLVLYLLARRAYREAQEEFRKNSASDVYVYA